MPSKGHGEFFSLGPPYCSAYWPYVEVNPLKPSIFRNLQLSNEFHTTYVALNSWEHQSNSNNIITLSLLPSWLNQQLQSGPVNLCLVTFLPGVESLPSHFAGVFNLYKSLSVGLLVGWWRRQGGEVVVAVVGNSLKKKIIFPTTTPIPLCLLSSIFGESR